VTFGILMQNKVLDMFDIQLYATRFSFFFLPFSFIKGILYMHMDLTKGVYIYNDQSPFTLPVAHETLAYRRVLMDAMTVFKYEFSPVY
jgi:hypothetical protein